MVSITENMRHGNAELLDSMAWHEANGHFKTEQERKAYEAGFNQGWGKCRASISLHGGIKADRERVIDFPTIGV